LTPSGLESALSTWRFAEPAGLLGLALIPVLLSARRRRPRISWPSFDGFRDVPRGRAGVLRLVPAFLWGMAVVSLSIGLARPQTVGGQTRIASRGVAIEVVIDRSASMSAADFAVDGKPSTRLDAARETLAKFIRARPDDLIGIVAFADIPIRVAPPTLDHAFVIDAGRSIRPALSGEGGTNLGHAIALGLGELRAVSVPRKVLILLTDGNDAPAVSETLKAIAPEDAARLARRLGVTLHTIAIGGEGAPPNLGDASGKNVSPISERGADRERLRTIAELGGGKAFSATDAGSLSDVFRELDALEKSPVVATIRTRYRDWYPVFVGVGLALLIAARVLESTLLLRLP
jgi:Ca-activated chloride channel family protein